MTLWWSLWLTLEVISWYIILYNNNQRFNLYYLIWQRLSILCIIYTLIVYKNNFLLLILLILKISLPPFHFWFLIMFYEWSWKSLNIFLFIHKYTPTILLVNYLDKTIWCWLILFPLIRFLTIWNDFNLKCVLYSVLLAESRGFIISWLCRYKMFITYIIFNRLIITFFIVLYNYYKINKYFIKFREGILITLIFSMPPFITFGLKWIVSSISSLILIILLLLFNLSIYFLIWRVYVTCFKYKQVISLNINKSVYLIILIHTLCLIFY